MVISCFHVIRCHILLLLIARLYVVVLHYLAKPKHRSHAVLTQFSIGYFSRFIIVQQYVWPSFNSIQFNSKELYWHEKTYSMFILSKQVSKYTKIVENGDKQFNHIIKISIAIWEYPG